MSLRGVQFATILLLTSTLALGQDESDLEHFQSFFSEQQSVPLEQSLRDHGLRLEQAREIGDGREQASALRDLGLIHLRRVYDYEKAMDFLINALAIEDSLGLEAQKTLTYVAIARVFEAVGDFDNSAGYLEQTFKLNEAKKALNSLAMVLNNLGRVNAARGRIEDAFANYEQVLRYEHDISKDFEAEAYFNLAHLYTLQGNYTSALKNHKKALAVTRAMGHPYREAISLNDIGVLYARMEQEEKSLANHLVALEIRKRIGDKKGIAESLNNLGSLYLKQGDIEQAISKGLVALENGRESQSQDQIFRSYELLSQSYKSLGDFRNALMYKELTLAILEFIQSEKHEHRLLETRNRYVVGKKESQIQKLEALRIQREREIEDQKKFRNILFLVVALVVVTAGLLFILYLVKRRSNRILQVAKKEVQSQNVRLQELNHTKDKFFSIISHDLKGPLNSLTSFSRLLIDHTDSMSREEIQMLARDLDKSVKNLLTLLENLLEWSRSQTGNIDFTAEDFNLSELIQGNKVLLDGQAGAKNITLKLELSGHVTVRLHKQSINTVVRNLITNAIKFTPEGGTIRVGTRRENSRIYIFVADNGVGMSQEVMEKLFRIDSKHSTTGTANEKGTGLGLILCREFVERNGGKIGVQSSPGKGSIFSFSFPESVCKVAAEQVTETVSF